MLLHELTLREARDRLAARSVSAVELVEVILRRIEETEPLVHAYATVMAESALAAARGADRELARGEPRGPLHGIPVAVKDVLFTHEAPTEAGSRVLAGFVPPRDARAVQRLREAGAVLVGKLVTHEFACGQNNPPTRNAWNVRHRPGGSSAGAGVAVAVGSAFAALGTDAGGSVRKPASLNGVVGLKPTFGRVSKQGVIPPGLSLDQVGPLSRTVEDCALVLESISERGPAERPPASGWRLGVAGYFFGPELQPEVRGAVEAAIGELERLGATLVSVEIPSLEWAVPAGFTIFLGEAPPYHRRWLRERPHDYEPETRRMLEMGSLVPAAHVAAALRARAPLCAAVRAAFAEARLDALVTPTLPRPSIAVDEMDAARDLPAFLPYVFPANLTGQPALTVPCGFTSDGRPIGLQLVGRPFADETVLAIGQAYQRATTWHLRRPPLGAA